MHMHMGAVSRRAPRAATPGRQRRHRGGTAGVAVGLVVGVVALAAGMADGTPVSKGRNTRRCINDCSYGASTTQGADGVNTVDVHGFCNETPMPLCSCIDAWDGGAWDCSERACPSGRAWFDPPTDSTTAHTSTLACSGKGSCLPRSGECQCGADFEGHACQRLRCPGVARGAGACSGHGRCATMAEAAAPRLPGRKSLMEGGALPSSGGMQYAEWDADAIQGCTCDAGWEGYDCSQRACPTGSDPLYTGTLEVQAVRTDAPPVWEVQRITFTGAATAGSTGSGGSGDVDAVQVLTLNGGTALPDVTFTLTFDTSGVSPGCLLCTGPATSATTTPITILAADGGTPAAAAAVTAALVALANIGAGGVTVTASVVAFAHSLAVTFVGVDVGGAVTLLTGTVVSSTPATTFASATTVTGSEVTGTVTLSFDDAGSWPTAAALAAMGDTTDSAALTPAGVQTAGPLAISATTTSVAAALTAAVLGGMETPGGTVISVSRIGAGGPGIVWEVTFASGAVRSRGNVAQIGVAVTALTLTHGGSLVTPTAAATPTTATQGSFAAAGDTFTLTLPYTDASGTASWTAATTPLAWNADATALAAAINALDAAGYGTGVVSASRARYSSGAGGGNTGRAWTGGYEWRVTYTSVAGDVAPLAFGASTLTAPGATTAVATITDGDAATAEVNAVQVIDCACPTCTTPASEGVRLTWSGATTSFIPYTASAATVRAALLGLGNLAGVAVSVVDRASGTTAAWCDADGSTTAITFTHSTAPVPPLQIAPGWVASHVTLPAGSTFGIRTTGAGGFGARAVTGTRVARPCSGRGACNSATGTCTCYAVSGVAQYAGSDGAGGGVAAAAAAAAAGGGRTGTENCGFPVVAISACPLGPTGVACDGVGTCSGAPGYRCSCPASRSGGACELLTCPGGNAWYSVATGGNPTGHPAGSTCAARGTCDTTAGRCACDGSFRGVGCELMACPPGGATAANITFARTEDTCGGGSACVSLATLAANHTYNAVGQQQTAGSGVAYTTAWDAAQIRGCACNRTRHLLGPNAYGIGHRTGWACTEFTCPAGNDPQESDALGASIATEVQRVTCNLTAGHLTATFRNTTTRRFPVAAAVTLDDASPDYLYGAFPTLERILMEMVVVGGIALSTDVAGGALCAAGNPGAATYITYTSLEGPLPLLELTPSAAALAGGGNVTVERVRPAAFNAYTCSRRGVCTRSTGTCVCAPQYGNSDGAYEGGQLGDCGNKDVLHGLHRDLATSPNAYHMSLEAAAAAAARSRWAVTAAVPFVQPAG